MNAEQKERRRKLRAFALAVADPTSPTYGNAVDSYIFGFGFSEEDIKTIGITTLRARAHRARHSPFVVKAVQQVQEKIQAVAGLSLPEYTALLLERERLFARRGIPGDAAASARLLQFLGKAAGHLADRPVVDPNEEKKPLLSGEELANAFIDAAQRLQRLREPNPLPKLPSATAEIIVEEPKE